MGGTQGHVTPKVTDLIRLDFELVQDFMPVLGTSKFDGDPKKNEHATLETFP